MKQQREQAEAALVSTPLPSGKVCDARLKKPSGNAHGSSFNTFTFWEGLRPDTLRLRSYQLRAVSTPLPSGKVCDLESRMGQRGRWCGFNTFTFWEGLRPG